MELWSEEFFAETTFWKYSGCDDLCCDVINSKLGLKKCKLVFHVSTVRERWKSIVQRNLRSIRFLNHYLKILKFWLPVRMTLTQKWVKRATLVFHVTILIDESQELKVLSGELFIYKTFLSKFWSFNLMWWRHQPKVGSKACPSSYVMY